MLYENIKVERFWNGSKGNSNRKKILLFIGQYEGLQFSISGLGLYKCEKEFSCKSDIINIYLGKLIISYNKKAI